MNEIGNLANRIHTLADKMNEVSSIIDNCKVLISAYDKETLEEAIKRKLQELEAWKGQRNSLAKENVKMREALKLCGKAFYRWDGEKGVSSGHWFQLDEAKKAVEEALGE